MTNDHVGVLFEQIIDQNKAVLEAVGSMQDEIKTLARQSALDELRVEVDIIRRAVTGNRKDHDKLEEQVSRLETKLA